MNGLFLQGGGAKGAFQAGAIYALYERGIKFKYLSCTSIGAVNGYFIYKNKLDEMREFYTKNDIKSLVDKIKVTNIIPNDYLINEISQLCGENNNDINGFYVNYSKVTGKNIEEIRNDLTKLSNEDAINCVKYSSLLPYVISTDEEKIEFNQVAKTFDSKKIMKDFKTKLNEGAYDKMNIDGGILNNNFMEPFIDKKVDKLYLIALHNGFEIPNYILNKYKREEIVLIQRENYYNSNDSLNYSKEFLRLLFKQGYIQGLKAINN